MQVPVITVDGPSGSGKGTLCRKLAASLGWRILDSGALYRLTAIATVDAGLSLENEEGAAKLAANLPVEFAQNDKGSEKILLNGVDVTARVRAEETGGLASQVAPHPQVRANLLVLQKSFRQAPGLIADGRDMGTVIFPDAEIKVFLTASAQARAQRRVGQLQDIGQLPSDLDSDSLARLTRGVAGEIAERDERDATRKISPLKPAEDALVLDSTELGIEQVFTRVMELVEQRLV
jgi:cytidylate kinase